MACVVCGRNIKPYFDYFCFACYHNLKHKLGVSRNGFRKYLRYGLGVHLHIPEDWDFKQVYDCVLETHPTLFSLANLVENALFLKLVFRKDLDLKPNHSNSLNDHTTTNHGFDWPFDGRLDYKSHQQIHFKQPDIRYLL